jgi:predicted N-acyltransferase
LESDYERAFAGYNTTRRAHVRRAYRSGVIVREAISPDCVDEYYKIHKALVEDRGNYNFIYPAELFLELQKIRSHTRFLIAEYEGRIIGGAIFFRDGDSVMYWHGATDRKFSRQYASSAILDQAIRWACESRARFFNFGGSGGIKSLEQFKSSWGAHAESNWMFEWNNRFWSYLSAFRTMLVGRSRIKFEGLQ